MMNYVKKLAVRKRLGTRSKIKRKIASIVIPWEIQLAKLIEEKARLKREVQKLPKEISKIKSELKKLGGILNVSGKEKKNAIKRISNLRRQLRKKRKKFIDDIIRLKKLEEEIKYVKKHVRGTIEAIFR